MKLVTKRTLPIAKYLCFATCASLGLLTYVQVQAAGNRNNLVNSDEIRRVAVDDSDATQQTLNLNFSPERRERLRKALDEYARSVDPDHEQIEERRRAMQESIKERFLNADKDSDGSIDRQEATEFLPQIARHFSQVDTNQDELITLDELEAAQARIVERRKAAEAALEAQKAAEADAVAAAKRKSNQAANPARKRSL